MNNQLLRRVVRAALEPGRDSRELLLSAGTDIRGLNWKPIAAARIHHCPTPVFRMLDSGSMFVFRSVKNTEVVRTVSYVCCSTDRTACTQVEECWSKF